MDEVHAPIPVEISLELSEARNLQTIEVETQRLVERLTGDEAERAVALLGDDVKLEAQRNFLRRQRAQGLETSRSRA
jgi:hypothetical protein